MSETDESGIAEFPGVLPLDEIVDNAPFGVVVIDDGSTIRYANSSLRDILGHGPDELAGDSLYRIIPDRFQESHTAAFGRYLETGERHLDWDRIELRAVHRDGHEVPVSMAIRETPTEGETLYTGIISSRSRQDQLREQLDESIDALHELYSITSNAELSFEMRRTEVLDLGCQYLDLPYGFVTEIDPTTQRILASVGDHELLKPGAECPIEESYCRKTVESDGFLSVTNAATEGWEDDPAYERFDLGSYIGGKIVVEGELFGTVCFASHDPRGREFTDSERTFVEMASRWLGYEFQQRRQTRQLERQNERLDRFASQVSHDLRNPLSAAMGRLELAIEEHGGDEDLLAVKRSLNDADARIDEMLEFARIGNVVADPQPVSLSDTADRAWGTVDTGDATIELPDGVEVSGDEERIERLLENLIRNSIEHGATGSRPQTADSPTDRDTGDSAVSIRIGSLRNGSGFFFEDDGVGIPADDRETVFESGYTTSEAGSGFGLAIVREIASAHGWAVRVTESSAGGARFEFDNTGTE